MSYSCCISFQDAQRLCEVQCENALSKYALTYCFSFAVDDDQTHIAQIVVELCTVIMIVK